jgi:hypothetical protein
MASHYTKEANRVRLAKEAMHKLANEQANFYAHTCARGVGIRAKK